MKSVSSQQFLKSVLLADVTNTLAILAAGIVREITRMALDNHCSLRAAFSAHLGK